MKLYLDDDTVDRRLVKLLMNAGHDVIVPADIGLAGASDARHLARAVEGGLVLVSRNHDDFLDLHRLIGIAGGEHPGVLMIRSDNDPTRDLTLRSIVTAIARLAGSGVPIANQFPNHWR